MIDILFMSSLYKTKEESDSYKKQVMDTLVTGDKVDCTLAHPKRENLCQPGGFRPILKHQMIAMLANEYNSEYFVETGTYMGETVTGISPLFKHCWSIEASEIHYGFSLYRLSPPLRTNVSLFFGESQIELPGVLDLVKKEGDSINKPNNLIFFLDAHFSGGDGQIVTFKSESGPCPTLKELEAIRDSGINQSIILIDDFSSFGVSKGYPSDSDVIDVVKQINPNYRMVYIPEIDCLKVSLHSGIGGDL